MSHGPSNRYAWAEPGVEDLGGGVYRIPLPLGMDALRAVNIYAITDAEGVDLIDGGMAIVEAREELIRGLRQIGCELGDIRNFFVTHVHIDHYSLAVELRKTLHNVVTLGEEERANLVALREVRTQIGHGFGGDLHRLGAAELSPALARTAHPAGHGFSSWEDPDRWLADQAELDLRSRTLTAYHTPGHTRGHVIFHDPAAAIMFAGDHVLPHITPSIGFESAPSPLPLADYLSSLRRTLGLPDARLLPAHGPVTGSTHERVNELLAHHDLRLAEMHQAVLTGRATAYEVAQAIKWTRSLRLFSDLDVHSQFLAVNETGAHLKVLTLRGELTCKSSDDGVDYYEGAVPG
jgi:glyoxylase-like metal-dependent hydrolase (beta-lactamase superfamily II)